MGLMSKLFGKGQEIPEAAPGVSLCPHTTMTPRWDRAEDIGHEDRATGWHCEGCGEMFTAEEGRQIRDQAGDRLRDTLPTG